VRNGREWATSADGFGLEQPNRGLRQRIIVGIADTTDGCRRNPFQHKGFRERYRRMLRAGITVMNQSARDPAVSVITPPRRRLQRRGHHRGVLYGRSVPPDEYRWAFDNACKAVGSEGLGPARPTPHHGIVGQLDRR